MSDNITIVDVTLDNISQFALTCFLNPQNEGHQIKLDWLKKRFSEGLKIKLLYFEKEKNVKDSLNTFQENLPGVQLMLKDTCSYTVFGFLQIKTREKGMDLFWLKNV